MVDMFYDEDVKPGFVCVMKPGRAGKGAIEVGSVKKSDFIFKDDDYTNNSDMMKALYMIEKKEKEKLATNAKRQKKYYKKLPKEKKEEIRKKALSNYHENKAFVNPDIIERNRINKEIRKLDKEYKKIQDDIDEYDKIKNIELEDLLKRVPLSEEHKKDFKLKKRMLRRLPGILRNRDKLNMKYKKNKEFNVRAENLIKKMDECFEEFKAIENDFFNNQVEKICLEAFNSIGDIVEEIDGKN